MCVCVSWPLADGVRRFFVGGFSFLSFFERVCFGYRLKKKEKILSAPTPLSSRGGGN